MKLRRLIIKKMIQLPTKPSKPKHVSEALNSNIRTHWMECFHNCYYNMHKSGTLSSPCLRCDIPKDKKVLAKRLSFEVKITGVQDYYEIKVRMCTDKSRMVQGSDFSISYAHMVKSESLRLIIEIASSEGMTIVYIDASHAFQTNVISDP